MSDALSGDRWVDLRQTLVDRAKLTIAGGLVLGIAGMGLSDAGGPSAALLDIALLGLALWLGRSPSVAPAVTRAPASNSAMTGNQALLLVLALGGAAVLIAAGAASRPLHGLAVAPFAMAAFALSSQNSRDLRSGVLAAAASLLVLSSADSRAVVVTLCAVGLVPLVFSWATVRQLMTLDRFPDLALALDKPSRPWPLALVARLVVLTAVLSLLLPSEPAPHLHPGGDKQGSAGPPPAGERGNAIAGASGGLDLLERGGLDSEPAIDVPLDSPTLWQGGFVDSYTGTGWSQTFSRTTRPEVIQLPDDAAVKPDAAQRIATVDRLPSGNPNLVYSPGPLVSADATSGTIYSLVAGTVVLTSRDNPLQPYTIVYRENGTTSTGTLGVQAAPVTDPRWLQLPSGLPTRVRDLARTVTASATTTQDKVSAIEGYLGTHEKYTLDSPVPGAGKDAVDAFLFTDHVGFCEQFASAEAVMLRALGIPARVATGYGGEGATDGDRRVYRNEDAHAWVQVGYPGQRWVNSDPTAGSQLAPATARHRLAAWVKKLWKTLTGTATARRLSALGLLVAAALLVVLYRAVRRARRARGKDPKPTPAAALETPAGRAYQRLLARLAAQDRPRLPTETVRDLLFRLGARDADVVVTVLEAEWYGPAVVFPDPVVARVVAVLDGLALEALAIASP